MGLIGCPNISVTLTHFYFAATMDLRGSAPVGMSSCSSGELVAFSTARLFDGADETPPQLDKNPDRIKSGINRLARRTVRAKDLFIYR
jgi:hypothetical protein